MAARPITVRLLLALTVWQCLTGISAAEDVFPPALLSDAVDSNEDVGLPLDWQPPPLSKPDVVLRGQSPAIVPLWNRQSTSLVPVRRLSIPTPLKLLGDVSQWGGRLRGAYGSNFDGREMIYGNLLLSSGVPIGIDTEVTYRTDERPRLADRSFWTGDFNVVYRMKQIRWLGFRFGLGANWLTDGEDSDFGINSTVGFDFKLKEPWYVSTVFDWGTLGSDELFHWQLTGGIDLGRFELFIGYDFHQIRNRERKTYIAGGGIWF